MPKRKRIEQRNIAHCVPRTLLEHEVDEEGTVKLLVPRFRSRWMKWLQKRLQNPYIRVRLDKIGSTIWPLIDGRRTVMEIGRKLEAEFGEEIEPVGERLGLYLTTLKRNKFVTWDYVEENPEPIKPG